jgi:hypothetical protein
VLQPAPDKALRQIQHPASQRISLLRNPNTFSSYATPARNWAVRQALDARPVSAVAKNLLSSFAGPPARNRVRVFWPRLQSRGAFAPRMANTPPGSALQGAHA